MLLKQVRQGLIGRQRYGLLASVGRDRTRRARGGKISQTSSSIQRRESFQSCEILHDTLVIVAAARPRLEGKRTQHSIARRPAVRAQASCVLTTPQEPIQQAVAGRTGTRQCGAGLVPLPAHLQPVVPNQRTSGEEKISLARQREGTLRAATAHPRAAHDTGPVLARCETAEGLGHSQFPIWRAPSSSPRGLSVASLALLPQAVIVVPYRPRVRLCFTCVITSLPPSHP